MAARVTIERLLRDDDDAAGQSIREWKIEAEPGGCVMIKMRHGDGFIILRPEDVDVFSADLHRARDMALSIEKP